MQAVMGSIPGPLGEHDQFLLKRIVLYIFDFAHDLIRKPLTLFGIMR
jgi:hypothetical protein